MQRWTPQFKRGIGKLVWQKETKMAGAYKEKLKDMALLEMGRLRLT